ncbi:hypothetical protein Tco_0659794 [Tanacetum coccineum]
MSELSYAYYYLFQNTLIKDTKTGVYSFQLDDLWFDLNADLIRSALGITPKDSAHPFVAPSDGDLTDVGYLNGDRNNIHRRPQSPIHIMADDYPPDNLKFICKGGVDEYYEKYLKMTACNPRQPTTVTNEEGGKKKKALPADEEDEEDQPAFEPPVEDDDYNLQNRGSIITSTSAKAKEAKYHRSIHISEADSNAETSADTKKSNNKADTEILNVGKEQGGDVSNTVDLEERTCLNMMKRPEEDQAGSNPGQSHAVQARPNLEPMHEDFLTTVYPQVHESLKLTTEEYIHIENPPSSFGTLSSMNNLDDAFTFGDQFLNDKSSEDEPRKTNVETKVESMVTILIHQASSSGPPLSTPIIDLTPPKPVSPPVQTPTITSTTATTTTTLLLPSPLPQQSTTDHELATRVSTLEKICANFEKKNKLQDKTNRALSSRVYTLENHDLYSKIDKYVNEVVKEAVHNALQAPLYERFRDLFKFDMK